MKTTVDIPEKTLREAMKFAKAKTKRAAILAALEEFNRKRHMAALVKYSGTFETLMTNEEIEGMELERMKLWARPSKRLRKK